MIDPKPRARPGYERAVDEFAEQMKCKLRKKAHEGYSGWDGYRPEYFWHKLKEHVKRGPSQAIDVANLAMMAWFNERAWAKEDSADDNQHLP